MLLSDDVMEILNDKESMNFKELATKIGINKDRTEKFRLYLESMINERLLKYNREKGEYHL